MAEKKVTSHVSKALIISLILVVISLVIHFAGLQSETWTAFLTYGILIGGVIWACISYGNDMDHAVTFGNVFGHGFKTTAIVTLISIVFTVIFLLIFPEVRDQAMEVARQKMEEQPGMTDEQVDTTMNIMQNAFWPIAIGSILFGYLVVGLIAALIGAAVTKKNPPTPFQTQP